MSLCIARVSIEEIVSIFDGCVSFILWARIRIASQHLSFNRPYYGVVWFLECVKKMNWFSVAATCRFRENAFLLCIYMSIRVLYINWKYSLDLIKKKYCTDVCNKLKISFTVIEYMMLTLCDDGVQRCHADCTSIKS